MQKNNPPANGFAAKSLKFIGDFIFFYYQLYNLKTEILIARTKDNKS